MPNMILYNGKLHTQDSNYPQATAVAIRDGRILAVGMDTDMQSLASPRTRQIDLGRRRVSFFLKLLPVAALVYLVSPVDFFPALVLPLIGALDDAAIVWIGVSLFTALCPEDVVREHMNALQKVIPGTWRDAAEETDIVEVVPRDVPEDAHTE